MPGESLHQIERLAMFNGITSASMNGGLAQRVKGFAVTGGDRLYAGDGGFEIPDRDWHYT